MNRRTFALALSALALGCLPPARAAQAPALKDLGGTRWMMVLPKDSSCEVPPEVDFAKDGTLVGDTGCNEFGGTWETDGKRLSIKRRNKTSRNCAKQFLDLEHAFAGALDRTASAKPAGSDLILLDAEGRELLRLTPAVAGSCQ